VTGEFLDHPLPENLACSGVVQDVQPDQSGE
jgi:hypothetical protein